jgi:transcriptional regulator with XRE-family HTH domain
MNDVFVVTGISEGEKARLTRLAKRLRQIDLASLAKVNVCDITALEKNRYLPRTRKRRILAVLGLLDDDHERD